MITRRHQLFNRCVTTELLLDAYLSPTTVQSIYSILMMFLQDSIDATIEAAHSGISMAWHAMISLDRSSLLGVGLSLAALSTTLHYTRDVVYGVARTTCLASIRINDEGLLFRYVIRWMTETQLLGAHQAVEASVPFLKIGRTKLRRVPFWSRTTRIR